MIEFHVFLYLFYNSDQIITSLVLYLHIDHLFPHEGSMLLQSCYIINGVNEHSIIIKFIYSKADPMKYSKINIEVLLHLS